MPTNSATSANESIILQNKFSFLRTHKISPQSIACWFQIPFLHFPHYDPITAAIPNGKTIKPLRQKAIYGNQT